MQGEVGGKDKLGMSTPYGIIIQSQLMHQLVTYMSAPKVLV